MRSLFVILAGDSGLPDLTGSGFLTQSERIAPRSLPRLTPGGEKPTLSTALPALIVLGLLILGETLGRLSLFGWDSIRHPTRYTTRHLSQNDMLLLERGSYRLQAGLDTFYKGTRFTSNSYGFRGPEVSLRKPAGVLRIGVLGRSYTMGYGVDDDSPWPRELERMLNAERSGRYEVLNFAVSGYDLPTMIDSYYLWWKRFDLDVVLIEASTSDLMAGPVELRAPPPATLLSAEGMLRFSFLVSSLKEVASQRTPAVWNLVPANLRRAQNQPHVAAAERAASCRDASSLPMPVDSITAGRLANLTEQLRDAGVPLVLVRLTPLSTFEEKRISLWSPRRAQDWAQAHPGSYWFDTRRWLEGRAGSSDQIYYGDSHPNAKIHRFYAEAVFEQLGPLLDAGSCRVPHASVPSPAPLVGSPS